MNASTVSLRHPLRTIPAVVVAAMLFAGPLSANPTQFGLCINAVNDDQAPTAAQLRDLGPRWVRTIVYNGQYSRFGAVAQRYQAYAQVLALLNHETYNQKVPSPTASNATWNAYIDGFAAEMRQFAISYDHLIGAYEIWNEPDLQGIPATRFAQIVRTTQIQLRTVTSKPVITGGLAGPDWVNYLQQTMNNLAAQYYDGVGFHPYGQRSDGYPAGYGFGELESVINTVYQTGRQKPVWLTEFSLYTQENPGGESAKAEYLRRAYILFDELGASKVAVAFWFAWDDRTYGPSPSIYYGLVDQSHTPRLAWYAYRRDVCSTYLSSSACNGTAATYACDWRDVSGNRGCFPRFTTAQEVSAGRCGGYATRGMCDLNMGDCAWYICARECLPRGTPVSSTCACAAYDGVTSCDQHGPTCAYYYCHEKCLLRGTDPAEVCNWW